MNKAKAFVHNCMLKVTKAKVTGAAGGSRNLYKVIHEQSEVELYATSIPEAKRIARLLDLDNKMTSVMHEMYCEHCGAGEGG